MKLNAIEIYEVQAKAFRSMTGHLAPGKDAHPAAGEAPIEERLEAWEEWIKTNGECARAMLRGFEAVIERDEGHDERIPPLGLKQDEKTPRLFYWEEGIGGWCPAPDRVENIIDAESHFGEHREVVDIRFTRFDMTDAEMAALPEV